MGQWIEIFFLVQVMSPDSDFTPHNFISDSFLYCFLLFKVIRVIWRGRSSWWSFIGDSNPQHSCYSCNCYNSSHHAQATCWNRTSGEETIPHAIHGVRDRRQEHWLWSLCNVDKTTESAFLQLYSIGCCYTEGLGKPTAWEILLSEIFTHFCTLNTLRSPTIKGLDKLCLIESSLN